MGIFLGWIYLRTRSIWIPAIAHAAMNLTLQLMINEVEMAKDKLYLNLVMIGVYGVVALIIVFLLNRKKPVIWQGIKPATPVQP